MTMAGGLGHTLPYLIPHFTTATIVALIVVVIELGIISWIRHRFMESPWVAAAIQVVIGGIIVLAAGILIGGEDPVGRPPASTAPTTFPQTAPMAR